MSASRTKFYLDKQNAKWLGVCAGIADYTGIPRETVRRKLLLLEEKGWITKGADGALQATNKARRELEPLTLASIRYLEQLFKLFQTLLGR